MLFEFSYSMSLLANVSKFQHELTIAQIVLLPVAIAHELFSYRKHMGMGMGASPRARIATPY